MGLWFLKDCRDLSEQHSNIQISIGAELRTCQYVQWKDCVQMVTVRSGVLYIWRLYTVAGSWSGLTQSTSVTPASHIAAALLGTQTQVVRLQTRRPVCGR